MTNLPSPDKHFLVLTYRDHKLALCTKTICHCSTRPVLRGHTTALDPSGGVASLPWIQGTPALLRGGRAGPSTCTRSRKEAATAAHMALLHDGVRVVHYDDARECLLCNISFYPDAVETGVYGSKMDPLIEGQSAQMPPAEFRLALGSLAAVTRLAAL